MNKIIKTGKALILSVVSAVVLITVRMLVLSDGIDYSNGLYALGGETINTVYYTLLAVFGIGINVFAFFDIKGKEQLPLNKAGKKYGYAMGIIMIIGGAGAAPTVVSGFSQGMGLNRIAALVYCICAIVSGMILFRNGRIHQAHCIAAAGIIISYLLREIIFFIDNPLLFKNPQQMMVMLYYITSTLFWINTGRLISGGEKKLTRACAIGFGFFSTASSLAYIISCMLLVITDSEKWLQLNSIPDIEIIITALVPAAIAAVLLKIKQDNDEEEKQESIKATEN